MQAQAVQEKAVQEIEPCLKEYQNKELLRFITCGSVDDGKSTLIGRLLYESKMLFDDQLEALEADSRKNGAQDDDLNFALLVDGLSAEREQGITIDVAYRFFATEKRKFIVADTPGHEQYTRNMVTGASCADVAVILIDARKGVLQQTRRHGFLASIMGIRKIVVAINKMDLVGYSQKVFERIAGEYQDIAARMGLHAITCVPLSALHNDNLVYPSLNMPWYSGPTLIEYLEMVPIDADDGPDEDFRFPVQWVNRPHADFRGFAGLVSSGKIRVGDAVVVQPSGVQSRIARIVTYDGDLEEARAGQSVTFTLEDEIDVSRGDVLCRSESPAPVANYFEVKVIWMAEAPLEPGQQFLIKIGASIVPASVIELKCRIDVNSMDQMEGRQLGLNEIGVCVLSLDRPIPFDPYLKNADMGGFIFIDRITHGTVGAGLLQSGVNRQNIRWHTMSVNKQARSQIMHQKPRVLWFTGISGAGKSTIANLVESRLHQAGKCTYLMDGDNIRHGLNKDLGFSEAHRVENIRRVSEVAKLFVDAGLIVLVSFISPFRSDRERAKTLFEPGEFLEVFIDVPLDVAESRDPKGLYRKARKGEIRNFTAIDSPYEKPECPDIQIDTSKITAEDAADRIMELI
jgi:bifunctional enzyme CysN/CysC